MLLDAAREHSLDLAHSWLIGDRWVDIAAARAAGVRGVLLERPWSWEPTSSGAAPNDLVPDARAASLSRAIATVLERR
jgi:D-glycero-D-manno-heptose 1,7-bisphosphate phosphatase